MFPFATASGRSKPSMGRPGGAQAVLDRAPALKPAVERVIVKVVKSLQTMAGAATTIEGMLAGLAMDGARDVIACQGPESAAAILESGEPRTPILMTLDATLVHAIVELLCGGNGAEPPAIETRSVTPIDLQFSQILFSLCASAIQTEWAAFGFSGMRATKVDGGLASDCLGSGDDDVAIVKTTIGAFGVHGVMRLVLSRGALARFHQAGDDDDVAVAPTDPGWSGLLRREVGQASVTLDAHLEAKSVPLSSLATLRVGQILALPADAASRVTLACDGRVLYRGALGQDDDLYTLRIEDSVVDASSIERRLRRSSPNSLSKA